MNNAKEVLIAAKAKEVLIAAAKAIRERGHCKGAYEDSLGQLCMAGAINLVSNGSAHYNNGGKAKEVLVKHLWQKEQATGIAVYNDRPDVTKDKAIATLLEAAEKEA